MRRELPPAGHFPGVRTPATNFQAVQNALQTLPLGETFDLAAAHSTSSAIERDISGNFFYVDQAPNGGYATVTFNDKTRAGAISFTAFPGAVFRIPFTSVRIENTAQPGLSLVCRWGVDIDIVPSMSASLFGAVQVINGERARTIANDAFAASVGIGADATKYPHAQLFNPGGSGKNVFLNRIIIGCAATSYLMVGGYYNTLLTTAGGIMSKKAGGAAPVAQAWYDVLGAAVPIVGSGLFNLTLNIGITDFILTEPIMLAPGQGFVIYGGVVNTTVRVNFQGYQETA
jgi:hypothetical protein